MITAINLQNLRNPEFIQFSNDLLSLVDGNDPTALSVQPQYDALKAKTTELESLFMTETSSPISAEIEAADFRRDQAITGIVSAFNTYSYHFDATKAHAATLLQNNLKLYGTGIARENYQTETAIINNLASDWENKPELAGAITTLNLGTWVSELKTANQIFNEKYLARTQEYATASPENQKSKRAEVMSAYYELRKYLDAFSTIQSSPLYDKTINEINALIAQYNTLLNNRKAPKPATEPVVPN